MQNTHHSLLVVASLVLGFSSLASAQQESRADQELVYYDWVDDLGTLQGGQAWVNLDTAGPLPDVTPSQVITLNLSAGLAFSGPSAPPNRVDLVFVGDGYTSSQLGTYANHVNSQANAFFNMEPMRRYESYFNVHRVDVVSNESGVDNDPDPGILRDTAMDMAYWCGNTERLLCVSVGKALGFANQAPDVDFVVAVANSSKYGGAGYSSSNLGTVSGGNSSASQIMIHELGHAMGNLADEYTYGGPTNYSGPEPGAPNSSKLDSVAMASSGNKWAAWLGESFPGFDNLVSTFEGSSYSDFGVYRPTNNSCMRSLGRPFNMPSVQSMIIQMYQRVDPIDASSNPNIEYSGDEVLSVTPMAPFGAANSLDIQWFLDGAPIPGANGFTLDLEPLNLPGGNLVRVEVVDNTDWVRNENARQQWMTGVREFEITGGGASPYCVTSPNSLGSGAQIGWSGTTSVSSNEFALQVVSAALGTPGLFFYGDNQTSLPFGDGVRCVGGGIFRLKPKLADEAFGFVQDQLDFTDPPLPAGQIFPGSVWNFQYWYRDPAAGGSGFNLSDGLNVSFGL